jgi:hypothetical protein
MFRVARQSFELVWNGGFPLGLSGREKADNFPGIKQYSMLSEEHKAERSRRLNVIHCRRKRDRAFIDMGLFQEGRSSAPTLQYENRQLEDIVRVTSQRLNARKRGKKLTG